MERSHDPAQWWSNADRRLLVDVLSVGHIETEAGFLCLVWETDADGRPIPIPRLLMEGPHATAA